MKTRFWHRVVVGGCLAAFFLSFVLSTHADETPPPVIDSIVLEGEMVVIHVLVPEGIRRVTLEGRDRLEREAWEPRAVARTDGKATHITFKLPASRQLELLRVRGDASEPLPAAFYTGTNEFFGQVTQDGMALPGGPVNFDRGWEDASNSPPEGGDREVVESDIWKIRGNTLYFFNQYRGLQIIDLTDPDTATITGALDMPAAGEQMYLLGDHHIVLLARNGCDYNQSQAIVVEDQGGVPEIIARLPLDGNLTESRLVGTALYVASQRYRQVENSDGTTWEWGTGVSSFDLADPGSPSAKDTLWFSGYNNVVSATDTYFFVVTQNRHDYRRSTIHIIDITSPDGAMRPYGEVATAGRVQDKFKLNHAGGVLTTISEYWGERGQRRLVTLLETFRLPHPLSMGPLGITRLGTLELGHGERLHATRFDGDKVYVVTFFQIDPLWVVSLANPANPRIVGSVEVPGWSTFIAPLGDRLVTVGVETNRVSVSLFDVANPADPTLASRVVLGDRWSWSEANYDEKAFTVLPDDGLILVPFTGRFDDLYGSAIQLIDLGDDSLEKRGAITGPFRFRRATVHQDRVITLSGLQLQSVDATDRDEPVVKHSLPLAWSVDRVFLAGDYLIQVQTGSTWDDSTGPVLRVSSADTPDEILAGLPLDDHPVVGATVEGDLLYIVQGVMGDYYPVPLEAGAEGGEKPAEPDFFLTVVSLAHLPDLTIEGETELSLNLPGWGSNWRAVWPRPGLIVWSGGGYNYWWRWPVLDMPVAMDFAPWPYWGGGGGRLIAFDVSEPTEPRFVSDVDLGGENWWSFSGAHAANGLVYLSHQTSEYIENQSPEGTDPAAKPSENPAKPAGYWVQRTFLDVVDYADAKDPLVREPVSIPNSLVGLGFEGNVIYTQGPHWEPDTPYNWVEYLDASSYLGSEVRLVDSLQLSDSWPHPVHIVGPNIFIGNPSNNDPDKPTANLLESWVLSAQAKFEPLATVELASPAATLADFRGMLAVQESGSAISLFQIGDAAGLELIGRGQPTLCWGYNLTHADGDPGRGLWMPMGTYGVGFVPTGD